MANRKTSILKLLTGVFLLAIYGNVLFTQFFCTVSPLFESSTSSIAHVDDHDHHHGKEASHHPEHNHDHEEPQQKDKSEPKDDDCCNDETSVFFALQTLPSKSSAEFKDISFTDFSFVASSQIYTLLPINSRGFLSFNLPPPKIPDIRVFVHSFQI